MWTTGVLLVLTHPHVEKPWFPWRMLDISGGFSEVHEALCGPQPNPQLAHCRGGELGTDPVHGVGSDAMRTAGVAPGHGLEMKNHEKVTRVWFGMGAVNHDFNLKFQACQSQIHFFFEMYINVQFQFAA